MALSMGIVQSRAPKCLAVLNTTAHTLDRVVPTLMAASTEKRIALVLREINVRHLALLEGIAERCAVAKI